MNRKAIISSILAAFLIIVTSFFVFMPTPKSPVNKEGVMNARLISKNLITNSDNTTCQRINKPQDYCDKLSLEISSKSNALQLMDASVWVDFVKEEVSNDKTIVYYQISNQARDAEEIKLTFTSKDSGKTQNIKIDFRILEKLSDFELNKRVNGSKNVDKILNEQDAWNNFDVVAFSKNLIKDNTKDICEQINQTTEYCSKLLYNILYDKTSKKEIADIATWFEFKESYDQFDNAWSLPKKVVHFTRSNQSGEAHEIFLTFNFIEYKTYDISLKTFKAPKISQEEIQKRLNGEYNLISVVS